MCNVLSDIKYFPENKPMVVPLANLGNLQVGERGEGDRI
jgi:hypothetical protein